MNHNFHDRPAHPCNRLLNAIEPSSYVRPHRHSATDKDETLVVLRGRLGLILFDDLGHIVTTQELQAAAHTFGATVGVGEWHTALALEPGTVFFEAKAGPYQPLTLEEIAPWAPGEGESAAIALLDSWHALFANTTSR